MSTRLDFGHYDHTENHGNRNWGRLIDFDRNRGFARKISTLRKVERNLALSTFCNRVDYSVACERDNNFGYLAFR